MLQSLPSEDLYAFHIDQQITGFFLESGYSISLVDKPTRARENDMGFDSIFRTSKSLKYFALQYKRPQKFDTRITTFEIRDKKQYQIINANQDWMLYCFPLFTDYSNISSVLHHCAFLPANFWNKSTAYSTTINFDPLLVRIGSVKKMSRYVRWGALYELLISCHFGMKEESPELIAKAYQKIYPLQNTTFYVVDINTKRVKIVTNYISTEQPDNVE